MSSQISVAGREEWRSWLMENHSKTKEVWLVYYKKHTGKPTITYRDSVEEALCFGWIDGILRRIDDERYTHRFTPRNAGSKWSKLNIKLARKMIDEGQMTEAGLVAFNNREIAVRMGENLEEITLTPELEKSLQIDEQAWANFQNLAPSYRKHYILWLLNAKKPETIAKRLKEAIGLLRENRKLGMK